MARKRWEPGNVIRKALDDGWTYHARLLEFPWVVFYEYRTKKLDGDLAPITASDVLFTIAAHKDLLAKGEWEVIGHVWLDGSPEPPAAQAIWDDAEHCRIIDRDGDMRDATPAECEGLEPAAVWEPAHIADRLKDTLAGCRCHWLDDMIPKR